MDAIQILKRLTTLKTERIKHEHHWKQCAKYCAPERMPSFSDVTASGLEEQRKQARAELYDSSAVDGLQLLVSSIISGTTSPTSKWFTAIPSGLDTPDQLTEGERWLEQVTDFMFRNIHSSNFDSEVADFVTDLVTFGHAILYADQKDNGGFVFNTWNISNCFISSTQANGIIDTIYKEYRLSATQMVNEFGYEKCSDKVQTAFNKKQETQFTLVHAIYPRTKEQIKGEAGQRISTAMPFASVTIESNSKQVVRESGYEELPVVVSRFRKLPNSHYGSGMASLVLPDAITVNQVMKLSLQSAELNLGGLWIAQHDGIINPNTLRIRPNAIISANTVDSIKRLDTGSATVGMGLDFVIHLQNKIRKSLLSDQLTAPNQSPLTASEVHARVQIQRQQLGSIFGRMQAEYMQGLLLRTWGLAMRSGMLPVAPDELRQASGISFAFINPMAAAQKLEHVTAVQNLMGNVMNLVQIDPTIMDNINLDKAVQVVADGLNVPTSVLRTEEELIQLRQAKQEQQQAMQEQQQAQQAQQAMASTGLDIAKEQAKQMTPDQIGEMLEQ
ncbi:phage head-tail adapter protein [Acinetobacter sp. 1207_04]|uniref:portal protein n=1 Tax=Acinetobacter sp. 1207_04 TaxID=2604449 RepID=UPI00405827F1